jgi:hypothetical protein
MLIIISPQDRASQIATLEQQIDATELRLEQCQEQYEYEQLCNQLDAYITTHAILVTNCS